MSWIGPAILFFGGVLGAAVILFFQFVAACDRIAEEKYQRWLEERTAEGLATRKS